MRKRNISLIFFSILISGVPALRAESFSESWYMSRARENMKIKNYRAAAEAFEKALEKDPSNREALLQLAEAYKQQGLSDKAIAQYDRYLEKYQDDVEVAVKQAELLSSSEFAYRRKDAFKYFEMSLRAKDDTDVRLKYAGLLGSKKETVARAIEQYELILRKDPNNAKAKEGLLQTRSWYAGILSGNKNTVSKAIEQYQAILKENPGNAKAHSELVHLDLWNAEIIAENKDNLPLAIDQLEKLRQQEPANEEVHSHLTEMKVRQADELARQGSGLPKAIDALEGYLKKEPDNKILYSKMMQMRRWYAGQLSEKEDSVPMAIDQYEQILKHDPKDAEANAALMKLRIWYAEILGEKKETMAQAIDQYEALLKQKPDDSKIFEGMIKMRLRYAGLLGERKETTPEAIEEFQKVLERDPSNGEAHFGLARAYAWNDEPDLAYYHALLAHQADPTQEGLDELMSGLSKGREIIAGVNSHFFYQHASSYSLSGLENSLEVKFDPNPFTSLRVEGGAGQYADRDKNTAISSFYFLSGQYRATSQHHFDVQLGNYSLESGSLYKLQYSYIRKDFWLRGGTRREFKYDSFLSLIGQDIQNQHFGAARTTLYYGSAGVRLGRLTLEGAPYSGSVQADSLLSNSLNGIDATAAFALIKHSSSTLSVEYALHTERYAQDQSGFVPSNKEPFPGGYFSPKQFVTQTPRISVKKINWWYEFEAAGGPSFQKVQTNDTPAVYQLGGQFWFSYLYRFSKHFSVKVFPGFELIPKVYDHFYANGSLDYAF